jgi:hypothetical protein
MFVHPKEMSQCGRRTSTDVLNSHECDLWSEFMCLKIGAPTNRADLLMKTQGSTSPDRIASVPRSFLKPRE